MKKTSAKAKVLVIEDDPDVAETVKLALERAEYIVETAETAEEGISRAQNTDYDVLITDLRMPGLSGRDVLKTLRPANPHLPIIVMTGDPAMDDTAIETTKLGAYEYVRKPIDWPEFLAKIERAVSSGAEFRKSREEKVRKDEKNKKEGRMPMGEEITSKDAIIGKSPAMQNVYKEIGRVAPMPVTVLIRGETGTGKEVVARALFQHCDRFNQPFIIVNCVAIPETLLETELFGHEKGAFTGAHARKIGKFELADKGTIFLDEIGDMSLGTQAKLLRVLQEKTIQRVGAKETIHVDVRVLAATHRELERAVEERLFREDLYYRLNDAVIRLPALRERREDIPGLVSYFLRRLGAPLDPTPEAMRFLKYRRWPGNVRELKNIVERAVVLAHGYPIDPEIISRVLGETNPTLSESKRLQAYVAELLEKADRDSGTNVEAALGEWVELELYGQAIRLAEGDQTKVSKWLGLSRPTVRERLVRYGLHPGSDRVPASEQG
jgi:DNA-binding NtrC family response regulator